MIYWGEIKSISLRGVSLIFVLFVFSTELFAQEDSLLIKKYQSFVDSANTLFDKKEYQEAKKIYQKALSTKPDEKFARYRIEDINTILYTRQITETPQKEEKKRVFSFLRKKEDEVAEPPKELVKPQKSEPEEVDKSEPIAESIEEPEPEMKEEDTVVAAPKVAEPVMEQEIKPVEPKEPKKEDVKELVEVEPVIEKDVAPKSNPKPVPPPKEQENSVEKVEKKRVLKSTTAPKAKVAQAKVEQESQGEAEKRMAEIYPDEKTEEVFKEPNKTTTRIIVNREGKVIVYSKVEHKWGGVFYFMQYPGREPQSISLDLFNRRTK